ncbi:MAG TPA: DUF4126 domain-containing protein [Ktedonobacteraceae bacterium]|nr:DUF4126 domain-containing protein [Ktedonobacteraceae bacterium]
MNFCTPSGLSSLGTSLGLSQTTGYTPYLPLLALIVATRWFHFCQLNSSFGFITADWFLLLVAILTAIDLIVDLIPGVSTGWHGIHTAITPFIGGLVAAATAPNIALPGVSLPTGMVPHMAFIAASSSSFLSATSAIIMFVVGFSLSGLVHVHRFGGRAVANVGHVFTLGLSNVIISVFEDIAAVISIILSFLAPMVMLVVVIIVVLFLLLTFRFIRRGWHFLRGRAQT